MSIIDSHCHIDFPDFDRDRADVLANANALGVQHIIVPAITQSTWTRTQQICAHHKGLSFSLGLHPMFMRAHSPFAVTALAAEIEKNRPIAIGEIGLDFYLADHDKPSQTRLFEQQIELAKQYELPVILHVRKAHDQILKVLRQAQLKGGTVHAFSGSQQQADQYIELGFVLGIGGALTYERAHKLQRLFATLPDSAIVLETDAPDMPLSGKQGQRNSPEYLPIVLDHLARLRHQPPHHIAEMTTHNCQRVFNV
jgi:TatD DNase family protein